MIPLSPDFEFTRDDEDILDMLWSLRDGADDPEVVALLEKADDRYQQHLEADDEYVSEWAYETFERTMDQVRTAMYLRKDGHVSGYDDIHGYDG